MKIAPQIFRTNLIRDVLRRAMSQRKIPWIKNLPAVMDVVTK